MRDVFDYSVVKSNSFYLTDPDLFDSDQTDNAIEYLITKRELSKTLLII